MNVIHHLFLILKTILTASFIILISLQPALGQTSSPDAKTTVDSNEEALHQELRELKKIYEDAVNSGDLTPLAPLFHPQTSGVVALNQEFHSLAEMQQIFDDFKKTLGPGYVYQVRLNPERSLIRGNIAIVRGTSDEYIKSKGREFRLTTRWTGVLHRENDRWHLLRSQVSMDPFNNSVIDYFFSSTKKIYGAGGLVIGLVVGIFLGYILRARRAKNG